MIPEDVGLRTNNKLLRIAGTQNDMGILAKMIIMPVLWREIWDGINYSDKNDSNASSERGGAFTEYIKQHAIMILIGSLLIIPGGVFLFRRKQALT